MAGKLLRYREFMEPFGYGHELRSVYRGQRTLGRYRCAARKGRPDFEAREVRLFRRVAPHLGAGLKAAVLRSQAPTEKGGDGIPGVLVLDKDGAGLALHYGRRALA